MQIKPAAGTDHSGILTLLEQTGLPTDDVDAALVEHFLVIRTGAGLAATGAVVPVGPQIGLIRSVAVRPSDQGTGLGIRLLGALEERARGRAMTRLYLLTTTATHFFARHGYEKTARGQAPPGVGGTAQFTDLCPDSADLMTRAL